MALEDPERTLGSLGRPWKSLGKSLKFPQGPGRPFKVFLLEGPGRPLKDTRGAQNDLDYGRGDHGAKM